MGLIWILFLLPHVHAVEPFDFVIDLDQSLVRSEPIRPENKIAGENVTAVGEETYRIYSGAPEFIKSLRAIPGARISFSSGGPASRNLELLGKLNLPSGRTAKSIAYKILSKEDLIRPSEPSQSDVFYGVDKKVLHQMVPGLNLARAVIFDDHVEYAAPGEEKNFLRMPSRGNPVLEDHRLAYARGLLEEAFEISKAKKITVPEALWSLQWEGTPQNPRFRAELFKNPMRFIRKGIGLFKKANPQYQPAPFLDCLGKAEHALTEPSSSD